MDKFVRFLNSYKWTIVCALLALTFVILIFTINFWRTLLLAAIVTAGIFIGLALDKKGSFKDLFRKDG